ncbi:hypothetical protein DMS00_05130 [Klebsiella variicola]|nr:hypothetical protein DMS00_05130 [Klebsiella variicola]
MFARNELNIRRFSIDENVAYFSSENYWAISIGCKLNLSWVFIIRIGDDKFNMKPHIFIIINYQGSTIINFKLR